MKSFGSLYRCENENKEDWYWKWKNCIFREKKTLKHYIHATKYTTCNYILFSCITRYGKQHAQHTQHTIHTYYIYTSVKEEGIKLLKKSDYKILIG